MSSPLVTIAVWRRVEDDPPDGQPGLVLLKRRSGGRAVIAGRLWASVQAAADEYESWAELPVPPAPGGLTLDHLQVLVRLAANCHPCPRDDWNTLVQVEEWLDATEKGEGT